MAKRGKLALHKRTKFGMLPGDIPKAAKILLLEKKESEVHDTNASERIAASYRHEYMKKANKRSRLKGKLECRKWFLEG